MNLFDLIIVQPIFNLLMALYSIIPGGDFGVAVILFTVIVRLVMWPLVVKQLHQVKAMRKMQPELKAIKKKAKGNRQLEGMMMMELYKQYNINPFQSILILIIQLPIFIGLYHVIQIFISTPKQIGHYTYGFVQHLGPVRHLIENPGSLNLDLFGIIDLTKHAIQDGGIASPFLLVLAVGAGFLQYISSKQTMPQQGSNKGLRQIMAEAGNGKQADQSEMNAAVMRKMVLVMPFFMTFVMVNLPGAITLYYAVSTLVAVGQQHLLLSRDEEELEEMADKAVAREKKAKKAQVIATAPQSTKSSKKLSNNKSSKKNKVKAQTTVRVVGKTDK